MESETDERETVSPAGPVTLGLCCLFGSSTTLKAWPGGTGTDGGQRGESKGAPALHRRQSHHNEPL